MSQHGSEEMEARVRRLEQSVRLHRFTTAAVILMAMGAVMVGAMAQPRIQPSIRAHRVEVVDARGQTAISLTPRDEGGRIDVYDSEGHSCLALLAGGDGGSVLLSTADETAVAALMAGESGGFLGIKNAGGELAASVGVSGTDRTGRVFVYNGRGDLDIALRGSANTGGRVDLRESGRDASLVTLRCVDGYGRLELMDRRHPDSAKVLDGRRE